jgi:hypothetical protein
VELTNTAKGPRSYTSWNSTAGTSVVLADAGGQPLPLVPPSATPAVIRLGSVEIPPGQSVTDTLVFHAPAGPVDAFKLALAKSALAGRYRTRGSHFAFEIPHEILLRGASRPRLATDLRTSPDVPIANRAAVAGDAPAAFAGSASAPTATPPAATPPTPVPPAKAAPPAAAPPAAAPPADAKFDPRALDRQIQEAAKKEAEMAGKGDKTDKTDKAGKAAKGDGK